MLGVVPEWLRLFAWPAHLQADYSPQEITGALDWGAAQTLGLFILAAAVIGALAARRSAPVVTFGIMWIAHRALSGEQRAGADRDRPRRANAVSSPVSVSCSSWARCCPPSSRRSPARGPRSAESRWRRWCSCLWQAPWRAPGGSAPGPTRSPSRPSCSSTRRSAIGHTTARPACCGKATSARPPRSSTSAR